MRWSVLSFCLMAVGLPLRGVEIPLEARFGYYRISDRALRSVYGEGLDSQLSLSGRVWRGFYLLGAADYFRKKGYSLGAHSPTEMSLYAASLGLKYLFALPYRWTLFLGGGGRYFFVEFKNDPSFVDRHIADHNGGFFTTTGLLYHITCHFYLNAYFEYSWGLLSFRPSLQNVTGRSDVQVGGISAGGGVGVVF